MLMQRQLTWIRSRKYRLVYRNITLWRPTVWCWSWEWSKRKICMWITRIRGKGMVSCILCIRWKKRIAWNRWISFILFWIRGILGLLHGSVVLTSGLLAIVPRCSIVTWVPVMVRGVGYSVCFSVFPRRTGKILNVREYNLYLSRTYWKMGMI